MWVSTGTKTVYNHNSQNSQLRLSLWHFSCYQYSQAAGRWYWQHRDWQYRLMYRCIIYLRSSILSSTFLEWTIHMDFCHILAIYWLSVISFPSSGGVEHFCLRPPPFSARSRLFVHHKYLRLLSTTFNSSHIAFTKKL